MADEDVSNEVSCSKLQKEEIRAGTTVTILTKKKERKKSLHNFAHV